MARIRSIKPDYWKSEKLATRLPGSDGREARRLFIALWNLAEDHGVVRGNPAYIRAEVYPYDEDVTTADVARWLGMIEAGGFIIRFRRDDSSYVWIRGFSEHQRIEKPTKPTLPSPTEEEKSGVPESSPTTPGALPESSPTPPGVLPDSSRKSAHGGGGGGGGGGGKGEGGGGEVEASPPSPKAPVPKLPPKPPDDPLSSGEAFFSAVQLQRDEAGLPREAVPRNLSSWWSEALMELNGDASRVVAAYQSFAQDPFWRAKKPPLPFPGFTSQWRKYVPAKPVRSA